MMRYSNKKTCLYCTSVDQTHLPQKGQIGELGLDVVVVAVVLLLLVLLVLVVVLTVITVDVVVFVLVVNAVGRGRGRLQRLHEVLHEAFAEAIAERGVVGVDGRHGVRLPLVARILAQVDGLVEQRLVLRVHVAEALQEDVRRADYRAHARVVLFVVVDGGQVEQRFVHAHVSQQTLGQLNCSFIHSHTFNTVVS